MKKLLLIMATVVFSIGLTMAQKTVSGTVTDDTGEALIGASVLAKGTSTGTTTDIDGSFSVSVPDGTTTLVVSYTGYTTQEIDVTSQSRVSVVLAEGQLLDEIVVVAGGLEKNKARLGYALQNVEADDVVNAREVNLVDALNSKVAGVSVVSSSGSPGSSSNIRIRGNKSIVGTNSPLFVVDGVPIDNSSSGNDVAGVDQSNRAIDLNPNDIQSLTVLKGAAATALYGVRAANGAIVITTKRGTSGAPKVSISASYSADQYNKMPERQSTYAQGRVLGGVPTYLGPSTGNGFSWGPLISDLEYDGTPTEFDSNGTPVPAGTGNGQAVNAYDPYTFFITGNTYDLNASVSGGTDKVRYYLSGGRLESNGIVPNSTFQRTSFRLNTDADITDKLNVGMSANFVNSGGTRIQRGSNLNGVMLGLMRTAPTFDNGNGKEGQAASDDPETYFLDNGDMRSYRNGIYDNPYWTVNRNPSIDDVNRIIGNVSLSYKLTNDLTLGYKLGLDTYTDKRNAALDVQTNAFRQEPGTVVQSKITNTDLNSDLTLNYNKQISSDFGLNVLAGYNTFQTQFNNQFTTGNTLAIPGFFHISNATDLTAGETISEKRIHGVYLTADLSFSDYLFVNLTGRNDWSSSLPIENNTYQSYSISAGFAFSELLDLGGSFFDYGKLRASWGVVGNDAPVYATSNVFTQAASGGDGFITGIEFPNFGTNAFERSTLLGNPLLTPEKSTTIEFGGEFKFFRGRLGADITYFDIFSEDVIIPLQLSSVTGFTNFVANAAEIRNNGIELVVDATPVRTNDFSWDIAVNFTAMENTVETLAEGIDDYALAGFTSTSADLVPGLPYSVIYGNGFQRTENGDMIIGADGWPLQDPTKRALGDPNPDWTMGARNTFSFKGLSLSALVDVRQGGDMWCGTCGIINYFGTSKVSADERNDVVVFNGVVEQADGSYAPNTQAVALAQADPEATFASFYRVRYGFGGITEMSIFDTSWIRLREVTLGYTLPKSILGDTFDNVSIALSGRNLWLNTDYPGIDPETNLTGDSNGYGLDYFNMPNTKSYTATIKLNF